MLLAAGVSQDNPMLPTLFRVGRVAGSTFCLLENAFRPDSLPQPSSQLLIDVASRAAHFSSWSDACKVDPETLMLIRVDKEDPASRSCFVFPFQDHSFQVELPLTEPVPATGK